MQEQRIFASLNLAKEKLQDYADFKGCTVTIVKVNYGRDGVEYHYHTNEYGGIMTAQPKQRKK